MTTTHSQNKHDSGRKLDGVAVSRRLHSLQGGAQVHDWRPAV